MAYCWLAVDHGSPWLWNVAIHESGRYTLGETVFYFGHFLREIPTDVAYVLFLLAGVSRSPPIRGGRPVDEGRARLAASGALLLAVALAAAAFVVAAERHGANSALADLLQFRTRDDLSSYGSHWRFHWLSTAWFGVVALLLTGRSPGDPGGAAVSRASSTAPAWIAWGYFFGLTAVWGFSGEIFTSVRYAGHQAREILTHGAVTLPLALGVLRLQRDWLSVSDPDGPPRRLRTAVGSAAARRTGPGTWLSAGLAFAIPAYLAAVALSGDVMEAGQSEHGLSAMVAGHFFEHVLDYVFVVCLTAGARAAWLVRLRRPGRGRPSG